MIGNKIISLRNKFNMKQEELALKLGVTRPMLSHYEHNLHNPPIPVLIQLADIFNVSVDFLLEHHSKNKSQFSEDEKELLKLYRMLNINKQEEVLNFLKYTLQNNKSATPPPAKTVK